METSNTNNTPKKNSVSETGHAINVSNFETLIIICTNYGTNYNPSNNEIKLTELTTLHTQSKQALTLVNTTQTPFSNFEGQRQILFKPLKSLATKVLGALRGANVASTVIKDAETINRKIQGKRASSKTTPEGETPKDQISVAQQSYDQLIEHFDKLIALVSLEPKYNPNETPLKTNTLVAYKTQLEISNTNVKNTFTPYNNALIARNKKLYDPETGLITRAAIVKNYVKSVYGASSDEYKAINKLRFKTN